MTILPLSASLRCSTATRFLPARKWVSLACLQLHFAEYKPKRRKPQLQPHNEADLNSEDKLRVSIVPPRNDCGVRLVMYRHFIDRSPFELHVASNADFADDLLVHTSLRRPCFIYRVAIQTLIACLP